MKKLIILTIGILIHVSVSSQEISDPSKYSIGKEGQIFVLKITPKDRRIEIRFVDNPLVSLEPSRIYLTGNVQGSAGSKQIHFEQNGEEVRLKQPLLQNHTYEFNIKDRVTNKSEIIKLKTHP